MNYTFAVSSIVLAITVPFSAAQTTAGMQTPAPVLQRGINVELPITRSAVLVPEADKENSLIVTITYDGSVYFGVDSMSPITLAERIKNVLSNQGEKTLFIKADARAPYAKVVEVIDAAHKTGVERITLLTGQQDPVMPGSVVPPQGLELQVAPTYGVR